MINSFLWYLGLIVLATQSGREITLGFASCYFTPFLTALLILLIPSTTENYSTTYTNMRLLQHSSCWHSEFTNLVKYHVMNLNVSSSSSKVEALIPANVLGRLHFMEYGIWSSLIWLYMELVLRGIKYVAKFH